MRPLALAAVLVSVPGIVGAAPRWTFCVAAANGGSEVWISDVFAADVGREKLEGAFRSAVERLGAPSADAQCPSPRDDRTVAVNAQIDAEAFNRKMGANLHAVPASDFPGRQASHAHERPVASADARPTDGSASPDQMNR
jgi:hypothetical protein